MYASKKRTIFIFAGIQTIIVHKIHILERIT